VVVEAGQGAKIAAHIAVMARPRKRSLSMSHSASTANYVNHS